MAYFHFDESIHPREGFILGAFVGSSNDESAQVERALAETGFEPGVDEFKSGSRMLNNGRMMELRERLHGILQACRIGIVVGPSNRRETFAFEAVRGLKKILSSSDLGHSGHRVFLDEGLVQNRREFQNLVAELGLASNEIRIEQDSIAVAGIQLADVAAHMCATMLRAQMSTVTKQIKAGDNSGYDTDLDIDLAFVLWATLRRNFFAGDPPPVEEWSSQLDFQLDVESQGLYIAESCSDDLRRIAVERFGKMYIGCIH